MPGWLAWLVAGGNNNNPHRTLKQFQKMKPPVFEREADPMQTEGVGPKAISPSFDGNKIYVVMTS